MFDLVKNRTKHLRRLVEQRALSQWAALATFLYALFVFWRDEFATPEQQASIRGVNVLPNWSLSVWISLFLGMVCVWLFEASFRLHRTSSGDFSADHRAFVAAQMIAISPEARDALRRVAKTNADVTWIPDALQTELGNRELITKKYGAERPALNENWPLIREWLKKNS